MNAAHLHLILNHAPFFAALGALLLLLAGAATRKRDLVVAALALAIATGVLAAATFASGRAAADVIGRVDGIDQDAIAPHASAALVFTVAAIVTSVIAAAALRWQRITIAAAVALSVTLLLGIRTAERGGAIHHPELSECGGSPPLSGDSKRLMERSYPASQRLDASITFAGLL